jgi:hypothetical protein
MAKPQGSGNDRAGNLGAFRRFAKLATDRESKKRIGKEDSPQRAQRKTEIKEFSPQSTQRTQREDKEK